MRISTQFQCRNQRTYSCCHPITGICHYNNNVIFAQIVNNLRDNNNILVLGTEEYMYPALYTANKLEAQGKEVRFHATTRSPIAVSTEENYPLQVRYELASLYDRSNPVCVIVILSLSFILISIMILPFYLS